MNMRTSTTVFNVDMDTITVSDIDPSAMMYALPPGTYAIRHSQLRGYYLIRQNVKETTGKVYGDVKERAKRALTTYDDRLGRNTGVLLSGLRGTGKTVLAREICDQMVASGGIVLLIQEGYSGEDFNLFLTSIKQRAVILIDEFEKVYDEDNADQQALLTLMDGIEADHKLWVLTINTLSVDECLFNRPSRIFYHYKYNSLPRDIVEEICVDKGFPEEKTKQLLTYYHMFLEPTFDVVVSLIEECTRFGLMPADAVKVMNILAVDPTNYLDEAEMKLYVDGKLKLSWTEDQVPPASRTRFRFDNDSFGASEIFMIAQMHPNFEKIVDKKERNAKDVHNDYFYEFNTLMTKYVGMCPETGSFIHNVTNLNTPDVKILIKGIERSYNPF